MVWARGLGNHSIAYGLRIPARSLVCMCASRDISVPQKAVAVIGAGAAGLVAARELQRQNHKVTVFERSDRCGGIWVYTDDVEAEDLTGQAKDRKRVHGSMYNSLRTNLPRHVMAFTDLPFTFGVTKSADNQLYCSHEEVLRYLDMFDKAFQISKHTRLNTAVQEVLPIERLADGSEAASGQEGTWPRWEVKSRDLVKGTDSVEEFDAVVVCNGHYSEPRVPELPGQNSFPGRQLHTHNFRTNHDYRDKVVVIMGVSASGQDISREIADVAKKVYFSARPMKFGNKVIAWDSSDVAFGACNNIYRRAAILSLGSDGSVSFVDGWRADDVDIVVYATGYCYSFPFLEKAGLVSVCDNRVDPLYQHAICSSHPSLSFVGIPWQVIPFPMMEMQARWISCLLSGKARLPTRQEMEDHTRQFYKAREEEGVAVRYSHRLGEDQWEYNAWLIDQVSLSEPDLPDWRPQMHKAGMGNIMAKPDSYRDTYPATDLVDVAEAEGRAQLASRRLDQVVNSA